MTSRMRAAGLVALISTVGLASWLGSKAMTRADGGADALKPPASSQPARGDTAGATQRVALVPAGTPLPGPTALHADTATLAARAKRSGDIPDDFEARDEYRRRVHERAEATASLVRSPRDLEGVLVEIERDIERSQRVTAFHAKSSAAAIRAAYRERPEEELEARMLELDHRLSELSAKFDPAVREGLAAGNARRSAN